MSTLPAPPAETKDLKESQRLKLTLEVLPSVVDETQPPAMKSILGGCLGFASKP